MARKLETFIYSSSFRAEMIRTYNMHTIEETVITTGNLVDRWSVVDTKFIGNNVDNLITFLRKNGSDSLYQTSQV